MKVSIKYLKCDRYYMEVIMSSGYQMEWSGRGEKILKILEAYMEKERIYRKKHNLF